MLGFAGKSNGVFRNGKKLGLDFRRDGNLMLTHGRRTGNRSRCARTAHPSTHSDGHDYGRYQPCRAVDLRRGNAAPPPADGNGESGSKRNGWSGSGFAEEVTIFPPVPVIGVSSRRSPRRPSSKQRASRIAPRLTLRWNVANSLEPVHLWALTVQFIRKEANKEKGRLRSKAPPKVCDCLRTESQRPRSHRCACCCRRSRRS